MTNGPRGMPAPPPREEDDADSHVRFVYAALLFATVGGFALAVWLPVQAALGHVGLSWVALAQVHGHLQVIGFAGLFVLGVATKLAPRFGGGHLVRPRLVDAAFWCAVAGLLARALGQPLATQMPFAALMMAGALLELTGTALFATSIALTLWPSIVRGAPHALLMTAGMVWLVVQALLGAIWLGQIAGGDTNVLRHDRDILLVTLQFYGFLLCVFSGVGLRSFPSFFGMPQPSLRLGRAAFVLLQGGLLLWLGGGLLMTLGVEAGRPTDAGQVLVGAAILALVSAFGWWRRETRLAVASQPLAWPLRATLVMLTLTGLLLGTTGVDAFVRDEVVLTVRADAVRHVFALGVITLGIVTMAQLILPEFASERLVHPPKKWRGVALGSLLVAAVVLRGFVPLSGVDATVRSWSMAGGGGLGLTAVAAFGVLFHRARRTHVAYLKRVAAWRTRALPTTDDSPPARRDAPPL
ncbi:MAG: hypothetical protein EPO16_01965 [Dehalococcoidia bacterium]|nr:MAG: hypothetical protein EPO16_01965 [Dehalococcoidia bacterium]